MKNAKKIGLAAALAATTVAVGGLAYKKMKSGFNPDKYVKDQVKKQYAKEMRTDAKRNMDFSPFEEAMDGMSNEKYIALKSLIMDSDIETLQSCIDSNKFSVVELVTFYLKRIKRKDEDKLNAIIELNPEALEIAKKRDEDRKNGLDMGILFGMPILLKDNIGTGDKMRNTAGAYALRDSNCERDAFIVQKLRDAGAVILGKANLSEWANFMAFDSSNGYSALGGQAHNPYGQFDVGGSSAGSAAAAASNLCAGTVGTETNGSIIYPASQNSVVAIKPTLGLLSRDAIIPIAHAQDTAGPLAKTVKDAALMLGAMVGFDNNDSVTLKSEHHDITDYLDFLDKDALNGLKIGLVTNKEITTSYRKDEKVVLDRIIEELFRLGAEVKNVKMTKKIKDIKTSNVLIYEFKAGVNDYLKAVNVDNNVNTLEKIIKFNGSDSKNMAAFGQGLLEKSQDTKLTYVDNRELADSNRKLAREAIDQALNENDLDLLITLSTSLSCIYAPAGYPAITVPAGYKKSGEPIGLTFAASGFQEPLLIKAAYAYEQNTQHRVSPAIE